MKESALTSSNRLGGAVISDRIVASLLEELRTGRYARADRLPAGEARIYGEQVRFIPAHADLLLPQGFTWQGALLGRMAGGRLHMAPRLRCLLPAVPDPAHSLVLDDISDITALLSGQSRQTGLAGNEAALWWGDLPLARMMLKQGRATLSFN